MARRKSKGGLETTVEGIGKTLGQIAARLDSWRAERDTIAADIRHVLGAGQKMLSELGHSAKAAAAGVRFPRMSVSKSGRKKGYKMSVATRAKLRAAWVRRKAAATAALAQPKAPGAGAKKRR